MNKLIYVLDGQGGKHFLDEFVTGPVPGLPAQGDDLQHDGIWYQVVNRTILLHDGGGIKEVQINVKPL